MEHALRLSQEGRDEPKAVEDSRSSQRSGNEEFSGEDESSPHDEDLGGFRDLVGFGNLGYFEVPEDGKCGRPTPLHMAATGDAIECVKTLLTHGLDTNARDLEGRTPMLLAASGRFISTREVEPIERRDL